LPSLSAPQAVRAGPRLRERLLVAAVRHSYFFEHGLAHILWKRLSGYINHQLLLDSDASARVAFLCTGNDVDPNGLGVGGFFSVEYLHEGRERDIHVVTGKAVNRQSSRVRHQAAERYFLGFGEFVLGHFPGFQLQIHILIERELALLYENQCTGGRHRLTDRASLK